MARLQLDEVANAHPEHITIKVQAASAIIYSDHNVAKAHRTGLETGNRPRGLERLTEIHQGPEVRLRRNSARVRELHQPKHSARFGFFWRPLPGLNPVTFELGIELLQRALIGNFPSNERDIVFPARLDDEAMMVFVHSHEKALCGLINYLQAEQLNGEPLPFLSVVNVQPQITQLRDTRHLVHLFHSPAFSAAQAAAILTITP